MHGILPGNMGRNEGLIQVSAVIPTYNRLSTLKRALDSVLRQEGPSFEILVVDDGSRDATRHLVEGTPSVKVQTQYFYQTNRGPSAARNLGIQHARGRFIAFLDSDDEWLPGKLKAQLDFFERNPDSLICQTEEIWIRDGRRVNPMKKHKKQGGLIFERCLALSVVSPSAVMMRREFFDEVGLFDESLPVCEDYDLWLRASARFPIGLIDKAFVVKYGGHTDQLSRRLPIMDQYRIRSLLKFLRGGSGTAEQRELAAQELIRKSKIVSNGARKRGKEKEAQSYGDVIREAEAFVYQTHHL